MTESEKLQKLIEAFPNTYTDEHTVTTKQITKCVREHILFDETGYGLEELLSSYEEAAEPANDLFVLAVCSRLALQHNSPRVREYKKRWRKLLLEEERAALFYKAVFLSPRPVIQQEYNEYLNAQSRDRAKTIAAFFGMQVSGTGMIAIQMLSEISGMLFFRDWSMIDPDGCLTVAGTKLLSDTMKACKMKAGVYPDVVTRNSGSALCNRDGWGDDAISVFSFLRRTRNLEARAILTDILFFSVPFPTSVDDLVTPHLIAKYYQELMEAYENAGNEEFLSVCAGRIARMKTLYD